MSAELKFCVAYLSKYYPIFYLSSVITLKDLKVCNDIDFDRRLETFQVYGNMYIFMSIVCEPFSYCWVELCMVDAKKSN